MESLVLVLTESRRHGKADRALHEGTSGWLLRAGELLAGPAALVLWFTTPAACAGAAFLLGALVTRFGWLAAGRKCACDPEAVFAPQRDA